MQMLCFSASIPSMRAHGKGRKGKFTKRSGKGGASRKKAESSTLSTPQPEKGSVVEDDPELAGDGSTLSEFPGPFSGEVLSEEGVSEDAIPVPDESRIRLPSLPDSIKGGVRRRRRVSEKELRPEVAPPKDEQFQPDEIQRLTAAYRRGGPEAQELISEIEKDPDYMFKTGNAKGEYELAAAIIGTGRPNKDGVFVLPYLVSSHIVLLLIILLGTFVYYPGFPLTEGDESLREQLRKALAVVFSVNLVLAFVAYKEAKRRSQPPLFWFFKTAVLGNISLSELKRNAPLDKKS